MEATIIEGFPFTLEVFRTKGKGVSFMENVVGFHGKAPTPDQAKQALAELDIQIQRLKGEYD